MNPIVEKIIIAAIPTIVSFAFGLILGLYRKSKQKADENIALREAIIMASKYMLKRCIIEDCKFYLDQGFIKPDDLVDLEKCYDLYRKLKGNHEATTYFELAKKLPVKEDEYKNET